MATGTESERERNKRHFQRTLFNDIAERYEVSRPGYPPHVVEFVTTTAGLCPGAAVLEIGCGTGQLTERLARPGLRVTAIDIGASMIAAARRRVTSTDVSLQVTSFEDLDAADAFVLASAWEGMPLALGEAMAMGKPVVATDVGGVREMTAESNWLVTAGNSNALAEAMARMMALSDTERLKIGEAARARILQRFSMEAKTREWEEIYRSVLR